MKPPTPPKGLSAASREWFRHVVAEYDVQPHQVLLLRAACEAFDEYTRARALVAKEGQIVEGRYGPRVHPAVAIARDARIAFMRATRELALDDAAPPDPRPPRGGRYT